MKLQKILEKSAKIKRYEQRITQFTQNRIFNVDHKKIYAELIDVLGAQINRFAEC